MIASSGIRGDILRFIIDENFYIESNSEYMSLLKANPNLFVYIYSKRREPIYLHDNS